MSLEFVFFGGWIPVVSKIEDPMGFEWQASNALTHLAIFPKLTQPATLELNQPVLQRKIKVKMSAKENKIQ